LLLLLVVVLLLQHIPLFDTAIDRNKSREVYQKKIPTHRAQESSPRRNRRLEYRLQKD
jgi:hypothetical protein